MSFKSRRGACASLGNERGFTLPELLIGSLLAAAIATLIATSIYQVVVSSRQGNDRLAAMSDLQQASLWLGRDASEARSFTPGAPPVYGTFATSDPAVEYRYSYDASNTALIRELLVSGMSQSTLRVARHIANQGDVSFAVSGTLITVSLTATQGSARESSTLNASMRVR